MNEKFVTDNLATRIDKIESDIKELEIRERATRLSSMARKGELFLTPKPGFKSRELKFGTVYKASDVNYIAPPNSAGYGYLSVSLDGRYFVWKMDDFIIADPIQLARNVLRNRSESRTS